MSENTHVKCKRDVRAALLVGFVLAACRPPAHSIAGIEAMAAARSDAINARARVGLPELPDPSYRAAKARFLDEEAAYRRDPEGFFARGSVVPCALDPGFESELFVLPNESWSTEITLHEGACVDGRFDGPVTYREVIAGPGLLGSALIRATFVDGKMDGQYSRYGRGNARQVVAAGSKLLPRTVEDVGFSYRRVVAGEVIENFVFKLRDDDPAWHRISVTRMLDQRRRSTKEFSGASLESERVFYMFDGGAAIHGPVAGTCWDYGRLVARATCTLDMPPTPGVPPDVMPGAPRQTMAEVEAAARKHSADVKAKSRAIVATRPGRNPSAPATPAAASTAPPRAEPAPAPPSDAPSPPTAATAPSTTTAATAPPSGQVTALCAAVAGHQAGLYAPGDATLRAQLAKPIADSCKASRWSVERIKCVLDATATGDLGRCEAMPAAQAELRAGDRAACRAAAGNQASLTAGGDASLQKSLARSIEKLCRTQKWPSARLRCVQAAKTADDASRCSS